MNRSSTKPGFCLDCVWYESGRDYNNMITVYIYTVYVIFTRINMNQQSTIKKFWSQPIESTEFLLSVLLFVGALPSPVSCSNTPRKTWHHRPWHCAQHNLTAIRFSTWRLHWFHLNQCTGQLEYRHHQSKLATNTHMTHMSHMTIETSKRILHNTPQQLWKIEASTHEKPIARSPKKQLEAVQNLPWRRS